MTNHVTEKIGVMFGSPETMPGGRKIRFAVGALVKLSKPTLKDYLHSGEILKGVKHQGRVIKNKFGPNMREFKFTVRQDQYSGIDVVAEVAELAFKLNVITNARGEPWVSNHLYMDGERIDIDGIELPPHIRKDKTRERVKRLLYEDHDLFYLMEARVNAAIQHARYSMDNIMPDEDFTDEEAVAEDDLLPV